MQLKVIIAKLTGRVSRNIIFWLVATYYLHSSRDAFYPYYPVLLGVMLVSFGIPGYINNLWLIPRFLVRGRYISYVLLFLLLLSLTSVGSYYETNWVNARVSGLNYMGDSKDVAIPYHAFPSMLMFALLAFGKFTGDAIRNQRVLEELQREKLQGELDNLRSQINPHFLFNALNTIYGMARRTDRDTAEAILNLSDILRHGLYGCEDREISVDKELRFVRQYVEFAQLRIYDREKIKLTVTKDTGAHKIAPMLLIPFIENAIKHGLGGNVADSWVKIAVAISQNTLTFSCLNSHQVRVGRDDVMPSSGIGLKNVHRRLELLYPQKHKLDIVKATNQFSVTLKLQLS